jgi:peptide-methionine (R)-S-oxide reductase
MTKQLNPKLNENQKKVLLEKETEPAFSGDLLHNEEDGDYLCANCGTVVFGAETKFDSGSGWPSFYDVKDTKAVRLIEDVSHGMQRIEVTCGHCGGHLGHVFNDAYDQPTGMRFCINSVALEFRQQ